MCNRFGLEKYKGEGIARAYYILECAYDNFEWRWVEEMDGGMTGAEKYKLFTIPPLGDRANSLFLIYFKTNLISKLNI
jgi:hypothetical protein